MCQLKNEACFEEDSMLETNVLLCILDVMDGNSNKMTIFLNQLTNSKCNKPVGFEVNANKRCYYLCMIKYANVLIVASSYLI